MIIKNRIVDISGVSDLLFDGMIYRAVSNPNDLRCSLKDMHAFVDFANEKELDSKLAKIESVNEIVQLANKKDDALSVFRAFLESSPYGLVLLDEDYKTIFSNNNASSALYKLFGNESPKKLKSNLVERINSIRHKDESSKLITLDNAHSNSNVYLIINKWSDDSETCFNVLLIPNTKANQFHLKNELIVKYKLTKKERSLLTSLIQGANLKEISEQSSVTINTTRSHLKSIFRKTNTQSQTNLIGLFLKYESQLIDSYLIATNTKNNSNFGLNQDLFVTLKNKNRICYRDHGPPDGRPLVIFHNTFGSRYHLPYDCEEILFRTNRRIIIPERPGYGRSTPVKNHSELWNEMFLEFIDHLKLSNFDLLANVLSCSHALQFLNKYPERINNAILTSPVFINHDEDRLRHGEFISATAKLTNFSERVATKIFQLWIKSMKHNTEHHIRKMIKNYSGSAEQKFIQDPYFINQMTLNFIESQKNNSLGSSQDKVFGLTPKNLDLKKINVPIQIWIGDEDSLISVDGAKNIYASLPNKTFHICQGHGEDIFYHRFEDIIQ